MLNKYTNIRTVGIRFILYSFIGVSGVAIDFILFYILISIIGIHYIPANIISIFSGATNNFILNARLNFKVHDKKNYTLHLISIYCMRWHALLINRYLYLRLPIRTFGYYRKNSINIDCHPNPVHTEHINNFQEKAMKKELGLVVPVYNESGAIKEVIQSWRLFSAG